MTITAKFPANLPTMTDWTDTGMGREKSNDKNPNDLESNIIGPEYSQMEGEVIAIAESMGRDLSTLTLLADDDQGGIREVQNFLTQRGDRAGFHDNFVASSTSLPANTVSYNVDVIAGGANPAFATVAGGTGVSSQTSGAAAQCGLRGTDNHFLFRSTYFRCRFYLDTIAFGPWANGDQIDLGLWFDVNNYVRFRSTCAGAAMVDYLYEIYDGGAGTDATLTGSAPDAATWHTFEILTVATGAYFFMDRGEAGQLVSGLYTGTAPDTGQCRPYCGIEVAAGGPVLSIDSMSCQDTRSL